MSYYLYDQNGYVADGPSVGGQEAFSVWAADLPVVHELMQRGRTSRLEELVSELEDAKASGSVNLTRVALLDAAKRAEGVLILSDGMEPDELRTAAAQGEGPVHDAADAHLGKMLVAIQYAFARGRAAVDKKALRSAKTPEEAHTAMQKVPGAVREALGEVLPSALLNCLRAGGHAGVQMLKRQVRGAEGFRAAAPALSVKMAFDVSNPASIAWAKQHAAKLMTDLSDTTQRDIADAITGTMSGEATQRDAYKTILAAVGDEARAERIIRTETMTAANQGLRDSWTQAVDAGLLTGDEQVEWIATDGCCDICDALDGTRRSLDGEYDDPEGGDGPPQHPNCRCTEGLVS